MTRLLLRPINAVWFEMLIARIDLASALGCIAGSRDIELESQSDGSVAGLMPRLRAALDEQARLAQRYASYWPIPSTSAEPHAEPEAISVAALEHLHAWAAAADPLISQLQKLQHERKELAYLERLLAQSPVPLPGFNLLFNAGPVLAGRIYLLETQAAALTLPATVLAQRIDCLEHSYLFAVGPSGQMKLVDEGLDALKARRLELPLAVGVEDDADISVRLEARLAEIARTMRELRVQLRACDIDHDLGAALADMALIGWLADHVPEFSRTDHFVRITGWTSDPSSPRLETGLRGAGIHHLIHFTNPPPQLTPPIVLRNPRWARPFEWFAGLLGTPGANEADPSPLLALLAPLMFGFMFGDVGQGAVLVLAGFALRKRYAAAELLIAGGIAAMAFGALFGSVFAREGILPALWLHPLAQPLRLLEVSLAGGSVVILIGLALDALESYWSGQTLRWWATRGGLVFSYLGSLACAVRSTGGVVDTRRPGLVLRRRGRACRTRCQASRGEPRRGHRDAAAASRQHALLRACRRVRACARGSRGRHQRALRGDRVKVACGLGIGARQCAAHRHRRPRGRDPDHASRAVRVLHPFPARRGPRTEAPATVTNHHHDGTIEEIIMRESTRPSAFLSRLVLALTVLVGAAATLLLIAVGTAKAGEAVAPLAAVNPQIVGWGLVAAALSTALAAIGAGYAVARVGSAAVGAIAEKPELFGRALVLVGLAEGIAIYGLIVSILILNRIA